jgi:hypothetical protein
METSADQYQQTCMDCKVMKFVREKMERVLAGRMSQGVIFKKKLKRKYKLPGYCATSARTMSDIWSALILQLFLDAGGCLKSKLRKYMWLLDWNNEEMIVIAFIVENWHVIYYYCLAYL